MSDYVLFSPLGLSDPTRGNFDGAFLHILRHLKPVKAYLFMTSEICHYDELDNRYEVMGQRVCKHEGFNCEIIKIKILILRIPICLETSIFCSRV